MGNGIGMALMWAVVLVWHVGNGIGLVGMYSLQVGHLRIISGHFT